MSELDVRGHVTTAAALVSAGYDGPCDLLVAGGTVVTEEGRRLANVEVRSGVVTSVDRREPPAVRVIDATGLLVLPGGIDAHTHFNSEWPFPDERRPADDFGTGTRGAAAGGITTVCDFIYPLGDESLVDAFERVAHAASRSVVDVALHMAITNLRESFLTEVDVIVEAGCPSFKFYTSLPDFIGRRSQYMDLLRRIGGAGGIAMFHCEDALIVDHRSRMLLAENRIAPRNYPASKPVEAEVSATAEAIAMASVAGVPIYLVHVSAGAALDQALLSRRGGAAVQVETRPLYLHLTSDRYEAEDETAARYIGTPPLRPEEDRVRLWHALAQGDIDVVGSDHVGFTTEQKWRPGDTFETVPKGAANVESLMPMLYSEGVAKGLITLERMVQVVATNPARIFGLYPRKGTIAVGSDADLCVLDPNVTRRLAGTELHSAADLELFEGMSVMGWPAWTISRGDVIFESGEVTGEPDRGQFVPGRLRTRQDFSEGNHSA